MTCLEKSTKNLSQSSALKCPQGEWPPSCHFHFPLFPPYQDYFDTDPTGLGSVHIFLRS